VNKGSGSDIDLETFKVEFPWRHAEIRKRKVVSRLQPSQGLGVGVTGSLFTTNGNGLHENRQNISPKNRTLGLR
jgi:hypothetical protein